MSGAQAEWRPSTIPKGVGSARDLAAARAAAARDKEVRVLASYDAAGSTEATASEVSRFIKCALSDVKLFPEFVVAYCTSSEHLLVESGELIVRVQASVAELRKAQERDVAALLGSGLKHDEELKKLAMQMHILEQEIKEDGSAAGSGVAGIRRGSRRSHPPSELSAAS